MDAGPNPYAAGGDLVHLWAPVFYQDTDRSHPEADFIVAIDFDGDWRGDNNWEALDDPNADLRAVVYYSEVETETHWFLLYLDFHPRDWDERCRPFWPLPWRCHENDLEGAMVVVEKDGSDEGRFVSLITQAHDELNLYVIDDEITARSGRLRPEPPTFENGTHPELYSEAKGHGVCALAHQGASYCRHVVDPFRFRGGDGVVYRVGDEAERPTDGSDGDVRYELRPLGDLWERRGDICNSGCLFDGAMRYEGESIGLAFDGDDYKRDAAFPPWAWDDPSDGSVQRGDFFFRPAETLSMWLSVSGVSETYVSHPYRLR